jgi:hypothetical protein
VRPYLKKKKKKKPSQKRHGGVAQGVGPEFKPWCCKKKERKKKLCMGVQESVLASTPGDSGVLKFKKSNHNGLCHGDKHFPVFLLL